MSPPKFEPEPVLVLSDLAQLKVLADPLRVRILEVLCRREATTKQVADHLGEKPTKLYHHVEALERVGLIRRTRTRPNRGTLEKYFRAVALSFRADSGLFGSPAAAASEGLRDDAPLPEIVSLVFDSTREELERLVASEDVGELPEIGVLGFCEIHASQGRIDGIRERLERLLGDLPIPDDSNAGPDDGDAGPGDGEKASTESDATSGEERRSRLTLAFYPLDRP